MPSFKVSRTDAALIRRIAARAFHSLQALSEGGRGLLDLQMDITACHANGCPLALTGLLASGDVSFAHDVAGIVRHLDRRTGRLADQFLPRFAAQTPIARRAARMRATRLNQRAAAQLSHGS